MGRQINFYHTKKDDLELIELIKSKMDIFSLPRSFKKEDFIPKPVGNYLNFNEDIFPISCLDSLSFHIIKSPNSDDYFIWSPDNFSLEWTKTRLESCTDNSEAEFTAWEGRFYMETKSEQNKDGGHYKKDPVPELKRLFSLVCRGLEKSSPYVTAGKRKFYLGKNMTEMILSGKIFIHNEFIKNPKYQG